MVQDMEVLPCAQWEACVLLLLIIGNDAVEDEIRICNSDVIHVFSLVYSLIHNGDYV